MNSRATPILLLAWVLPLLATAQNIGVDAQPTDETSQGVLLQAGLEAGVVAGDVYLLPRPAVGYLSPDWELVVELPLDLRLWDLPPTRPGEVVYGVVRQRPGISEGALDPGAFSQLLRRLRIGHPGDLFYLRGGDLRASQGHGSTVWRYASTPDLDRRQAGLRLAVGTDLLGVEAALGNVLAPQRFSAARAYTRPLLLMDLEPGVMASLAQGLALGLSYAGDWSAPAGPGRSDALVHGGLDVELVWLDLQAFKISSYADIGLRRGLGELGAGAELGLLGEVHLWAAALGYRVAFRLLTSGYRAAEFDAFYEIERDLSFVTQGPKALLPSPGGIGGVLELQLTVAQVLRLRLQLDQAPGPRNQNALVGVDVSAGPLHAGVALAQRSFSSLDELFSFGPRSVMAAELRFEVYGPLAVVGRYSRTLRADSTRGTRLDHDLLIGLEAGWVLR